jgi:hypothetical protein
MSAPAQSARQKAALQAVTANRRRDGAVVFRTVTGGWSTRLIDAETASGDAAAALLAAAQTDARNAIVGGPYLFAVSDRSGQLQAVALRERLRAAGPAVIEAIGATLGVAAVPYL